MATPAAAGVQEAQSRKFYKKFITWAESKSLVPSPQLFEEWDVKHNHEQFRDQCFGGDQEIFRVGLKTLYARYFTNLSPLVFERPDGEGSISVQPYRKSGSGVGVFADITSPKTKAAERDFMRSKLDNLIDQLVQLSLLLGMSRKELLTYIESK